jgi:hypothetical protein
MRFFIALAIAAFATQSAFADGVFVQQPREGAEPVDYIEDIGDIYLLSDLEWLPIEDSVWATIDDVRPEPVIYNGTVSLAGEFLPVGWIGNCTATAVGRRAVFTAAHCVRHGATINFRPRTGGSYTAICSRHPRVNTRNWYNDYALCRLTTATFPDTVPLATLKSRTPPQGEAMLLNGYGRPNVGQHKWGRGNVSRYGTQDIITCGPANLGGGDSGGPFLEWAADRTGRSHFQIVGVNSRGGGGCSFFNRINHSEFQTWARSWEQSTGHQLCGVSADCIGGGGDPDPDPDPTPPVGCQTAYERFAFCIGTSGVESCLELADRLKACVR